MRKIPVVLAVCVGIVTASHVSADRPFTLCDPLKSTLCGGLATLFEFEETSDYTRVSETGGRLNEPDGANVSRHSTHKTGTYALDHAAVANSYLFTPRNTGPTGQFTSSFWIYVTTNPSASGKRVQILSTRDALGNEGYPRVFLVHNGTNIRVRYEVKESVSDTVVSVTSTTSISTSTWYLVAFGQRPNFSSTNPYQQQIWVSVNAGAKDVANILYPDVATFGDFIVGAWRTGGNDEYGAYKLDQLAAWAGTFSPADLTKLYNSGSGKAFPFVD